MQFRISMAFLIELPRTELDHNPIKGQKKNDKKAVTELLEFVKRLKFN